MPLIYRVYCTLLLAMKQRNAGQPGRGLFRCDDQPNTPTFRTLLFPCVPYLAVIKGQARSLAQDAETVTRAREILRRALGTNTRETRRNRFEVGNRDHSDPLKGRSSMLVSPSCYGDGTNEEEQIGTPGSSGKGGEHQKCDGRLTGKRYASSQTAGAGDGSGSGAGAGVGADAGADAGVGVGAGFVASEHPSDALSRLAEALGVIATADACLDFIYTEKEAVVAAAKKRFGRPKTTASPALASIGWALAGHRLAASSRRTSNVPVPSHPQPSLLASTDKLEQLQERPSPLSSPSTTTKASSSPSSSLQEVERNRHFSRLRRAEDDELRDAIVVERSSKRVGDDTELGCANDDDIRTAVLQTKHVACHRNLRGTLEDTPNQRRVSWQTPLDEWPPTPPPPPPLLPPPPLPSPPRRPTAACLEQINFEEGVAYGRTGLWRASCSSGGRHTTIETPFVTQAGCNRAAHEEVVLPRPSTAGCSMIRKNDEEIRYCSSESDGGDEHQASLDEEEGGWADDTCLTPESLAHNFEQNSTFSHDLRRNETRDDDGGGIEGRPCSRRYGCYGHDSEHCRTGASGVTESAQLTPVQATTASQTTFPRKTAMHAGFAVQTDYLHKEAHPEGARGTSLGTRQRSGASFETDTLAYGCNLNEKFASPRRHHTLSTNDCGGEEQCCGVEAARPGAQRLSNELLEGNTNPCPRPVVTPHQMRQEDDDDNGNDDGDRDEDEEISCALARKRALLRVRLARQRHELATALVDANERGLRVERRRRREEKLVALLVKARRDSGVRCDGGGAGSRRQDKVWLQDMSSSRGSSERRGGLLGARPMGESQSMRVFILSVAYMGASCPVLCVAAVITLVI